MEAIIIGVFVVGYLAIALEHPLKINKTASALLVGVICWTLFMLATPTEAFLQSNDFTAFLTRLKVELGDQFSGLTQSELYREFVASALSHHLSKIAEILFFL